MSASMAASSPPSLFPSLCPSLVPTRSPACSAACSAAWSGKALGLQRSAPTAPAWPGQRGAALVMSLLIVLALLIIGISAARTALNAERAARAERDRHLAFHAAEAALSDAERDIEGGNEPGSARAALFAPGSAMGFDEGCGTGKASNRGLCAHAPAPAAWQRVALSAPEAEAVDSVAYGSFTGARMPAGQGSLPARLPRYIIELMPFARAGDDAGARLGNFYRVTAIGFGSRETTRVVLQTFYLKPGGQEP